MKRDWTEARAKVDEEGICRACGLAWLRLEAAHVIPRSRVAAGAGEDPRNIVPLCGGVMGSCHRLYDQGDLDLLPFLNRDEQAYAVELVGMHEAYRRITNTRTPEVRAA